MGDGNERSVFRNLSSRQEHRKFLVQREVPYHKNKINKKLLRSCLISAPFDAVYSTEM